MSSIFKRIGKGWEDAKLALGLAFASLGRLWRFAGWPAVGGLLLMMVIDSIPDTADGTPGLLSFPGSILFVLTAGLGLLGSTRGIACWFRWTVTGDDSIRFLDVGFGRREWKLLCALLIVGVVVYGVILIVGFSGLVLARTLGWETRGTLAISDLDSLLRVWGFILVFQFILAVLLARLGPGLVTFALVDRPSAAPMEPMPATDVWTLTWALFALMAIGTVVQFFTPEVSWNRVSAGVEFPLDAIVGYPFHAAMAIALARAAHLSGMLASFGVAPLDAEQARAAPSVPTPGAP